MMRWKNSKAVEMTGPFGVPFLNFSLNTNIAAHYRENLKLEHNFDNPHMLHLKTNPESQTPLELETRSPGPDPGLAQGFGFDVGI